MFGRGGVWIFSTISRATIKVPLSPLLVGRGLVVLARNFVFVVCARGFFGIVGGVLGKEN